MKSIVFDKRVCLVLEDFGILYCRNMEQIFYRFLFILWRNTQYVICRHESWPRWAIYGTYEDIMDAKKQGRMIDESQIRNNGFR